MTQKFYVKIIYNFFPLYFTTSPFPVILVLLALISKTLFGDDLPVESISEQRAFLSDLMTMLEKQFPDSEIVLHDYSMPYEHTIVDIRNGYITGRKVGDCLSNFGLEALSGQTEGINRYNYITVLPSAKIVRSSSLYFTNGAGKVLGCLCINTNITEEARFEDYLRKKNGISLRKEEPGYKEVFPGTVQDLLEHLISEAQASIGKDLDTMSKEDKIQFIKLLDQKGALLISKSGDRICSYLGISKFTLYKYLDISRGTARDDSEEKENDL